MEQMYFIGVDLSKHKVDVYAIDRSCNPVQICAVPNRESKLGAFLKAFLKRNQVGSGEVLVCCENTGIYGCLLEQACHKAGVPLWVENAARIKKASTQLRGKSDLLDSQRIAEYALRYADRKRLHQPLGKEPKKLRELLHARDTLNDSINRLQKQITEAKAFDKGLYETLKHSFGPALRALKNSLLEANQQLNQAVQANEEVYRNVVMASSVKGIGLILSSHLVVATDNFSRYASAKKIACHAGVVPFPNESGSMVKRQRVSRYSDRKLKTLLHLAALSAIRFNPEIKRYYDRKVAEGKNKMSVLNAVRNKLLHIVFAVVRRGTPYTLEMASV
jgi:transposase